MVSKGKRYPAQIRYDERCPPMAIRVTAKLKAVVDKMKKPGESYAEIIRKALNKTLGPYQRGYNVGYQEAKREFQITIPCYYCRLPLCILPNTKIHESVISSLKTWHHGKCEPK